MKIPKIFLSKRIVFIIFIALLLRTIPHALSGDVLFERGGGDAYYHSRMSENLIEGKYFMSDEVYKLLLKRAKELKVIKGREQ